MVKKRGLTELLRKVDSIFNVFDEVSQNYKEFKDMVTDIEDRPGVRPNNSHQDTCQNPPPAAIPDNQEDIRIPHCTTVKLTGVSFGDCQQVIKGMKPADAIILVRKPDNPSDPNAVGVLDDASRQQIGWIPRELSAGLAVFMDQGLECRVEIADIRFWPGAFTGVTVRLYTPEILEKRSPVPERKNKAVETVPDLARQKSSHIKTRPDPEEIMDYDWEDELFRDYLEEE